MEAVKTEELTKNYGGVAALSGLSLSIREGELFGLLGVNGAGKTTLIRILSGLSRASGGEAYVLGKSVRTRMEEIKALIGISPQETSVAPNLTVRENLDFFASITCLDRAQARARAEEITEAFGLGEVLGRRAKTLSGGWQHRLSIAAALVSKPKVLFLDEPTLGLDVLARRELWKIISALKGKITIVLTSHYLEEIEALCDRVAVLSRGRMIASGTVEEIKRRAGTDRFEDAFVKIVEDAQ